MITKEDLRIILQAAERLFQRSGAGMDCDIEKIVKLQSCDRCGWLMFMDITAPVTVCNKCQEEEAQ